MIAIEENRTVQRKNKKVEQESEQQDTKANRREEMLVRSEIRRENT